MYVEKITNIIWDYITSFDSLLKCCLNGRLCFSKKRSLKVNTFYSHEQSKFKKNAKIKEFHFILTL